MFSLTLPPDSINCELDKNNLQVFEEFEVESQPDCYYDHIQLYDGDSTDSTTLGRFCGNKVPHPIDASTNQLYMVFKSDSTAHRKGFLAHHSTGL